MPCYHSAATLYCPHCSNSTSFIADDLWNSWVAHTSGTAITNMWHVWTDQEWCSCATNGNLIEANEPQPVAAPLSIPEGSKRALELLRSHLTAEQLAELDAPQASPHAVAIGPRFTVKGSAGGVYRIYEHGGVRRVDGNRETEHLCCH